MPGQRRTATQRDPRPRHAVLYSRDLTLRALALAAGSLHRQVVDDMLARFERADKNLPRLLTGEINQMQKDGLIASQDAQRLKKMTRLLLTSDDPHEVVRGFRAVYDEFRTDATSSLLALGAASVALDAAERCENDPPEVMMNSVPPDVGGFIAGAGIAYGAAGGGEGGGVSSDAAAGVLLAGAIGAGVASGAAAINEEKS